MTNESTERLERWLDKYRLAISRKAAAEAAYELLEHQRKVVLAAEMSEAAAAGIAAVAGQEREARVSQAYADHLDKLYRARLERELAGGEVDALRLQFEGMRTIRATERVEARAYSST
jgi:uncharacterized protein YgbK (DUF1537 family)